MSLDNTLLNFTRDLQILGRPSLSQMFPTEVELYICAFEIIDSEQKTQDYFIFPVNPNSINDKTQFLNNVKRTEGGIVTLTSPKYVPSTVSISGSFGRQFRFILKNGTENLLQGFSISREKSVLNNIKSNLEPTWDLGVRVFSEQMKTGYGCCKILEYIVNASKIKGNTLVFHNLAFNRVDIVKPVSLDFTQDQSSNMIWNYNLVMEKVGDRRVYFESTKTKGLVGHHIIQEGINNVVDKATRLFNKVI